MEPAASGYAADVTADEPSVSVFAPTPLLTVTVEPGDESPEVHVHAGGQGAWIANMLSVLEVRTLLCGPLGGEIGKVLDAVLDHEWLEMRGVRTDATNGCQLEDRRSGELETIAAMPPGLLDRHGVDELCNTMLAAGLDAGVAVLSGPQQAKTFDADVFRRIASDLTNVGVRVIADLSGDPMEAALDGGVAVLKVSDEDVDSDDPVAMAGSLRKRVGEAIVLTRGAAPALVLDGDLRTIDVPELERVNPRGAGDSMTAGLAAGLARGYDLDDALKLGAAAGAVNVTRHGLASGRRDTIEKLTEHISIDPTTEEEVRRAGSDH
jgi:1-phosphofructokinase